MPKPKSPPSKVKIVKTIVQVNKESDENSEDETDSPRLNNTNSSAIPKSKSPRGNRKQVQRKETSEDDTDSSGSEDMIVGPRPDLRSRRRSSTTSPSKNTNISNKNKHSSKHDKSVSFSTDRTVRLNTSGSSPSFQESFTEYSDDESSNNKSESQFLDDAKKPEDKNFSFYIKLLCILPVIMFVIILVHNYYQQQNQHVPTPESIDNLPPFDRFISHIKDLEHSFPNQSQRFWRTVKASAMHVLHDAESNYPVVILMASRAEHTHISRCIAKKITSDFERTLGLNPKESVADVNKFQHEDPAKQKQTLDDYLISAFNNNQRKSFIIDNLQLLHPEAALLLHGYCDNDNAPYKDVMLMLLLYINEKDIGTYSSSTIENYLEQLWSKELDIDKVKALLSRVANNIIIVEREDDETLNKVCS